MIDYFLQDSTRLVPCNAAAAVIVLDDDRYLLQLRDQKPGLFYPGHWGLFGGAMEPDETPQATLKRELREELGLPDCDPQPLTEFTFTMGPFGIISRFFFEVSLPHTILTKLTLGEGSEMRAFSAAEILTKPRVVPYDGFAIWFHANRTRAR